ncbi:MAG: DoxX family protein [Bacteroidota bacterium]
MSGIQFIGISFALVGILTNFFLATEARQRKALEVDFLPKTGILVWISRIMIGLLFLYSGFVKANDYVGFAYKLEEYFIVFGQDFPGLKGFFDFFIPMAEPLAWFISVFEMALAVAILVGWNMNLTAWLSMLMMIFFTVLTGYSHFTGAVADCGCFGDAMKIEPWESFLKDIILTVMLVPIFLLRKSIKPFPSQKLAAWLTGGAFLLSGIFSYYCHEHLPMIDYRAYKVGADLKICTTVIPEGEDFPACPDWGQFYDEYPLFEGKVLMVIAYDALHADPEDLQASQQLAQSLEGSGITVYGATQTSRSKMGPEVIEPNGLTYPFTYMDVKVLKTMVRANPGYMLLNDGVILGKWHANDIPDRAALEARFP